MKNDPRHIALLVLVENETSGLPLDRTVENYEGRLAGLSKRDRALANAIIYGTLRWQGHLDWILSSFSNRKLGKIRPDLLNLMRLGLYQIVHLDKIPISAAVNTAVNLAKRISNPGAAGFVNAVLRKAGNQFQDLSLPDIESDPAGHIAVNGSIPLWLSKRWTARYGTEKTVKLCEIINTIPLITLRTNRLKTDRDRLLKELAQIAHNPLKTHLALNGITLSHPSMPIHETEAFIEGRFQVQDEAAQLVTEMLNPKKGERILDACAGLGGKTGHIGQLLENRGTVTAMDINPGKLTILDQEMTRLGITNVTTRKADLLKSKKNLPKKPFDRILLDAPCTGLGVLRRNPDSRWSRKLSDIKRLAGKQRKMMEKAAGMVKPGGRLLYSVCSCEPEETEEVVHAFLKSRTDFVIKKPRTGMIPPGHTTMISDNRFFRTYPDTVSMDGFFAAVLERRQTV